MDRAISPQMFALFRGLVEEASGLHYSENDCGLFGAKLLAHAEERGFNALLDYYYRLRYDDPTREELDHLIEALLVHETYFFRELPSLVQLVDTCIVPTVKSRGHARVWSTACSSGEEVFTLAMLLDVKGVLDRVTLAATDLSASTIARARTGRHSARSVRPGYPPELAQRYLEITPHGVSVAPRIRDAVTFSTLNLVDDEAHRAFGTFDAILCRNVLIYFDEAEVVRVIERLASHLDPDGLLAVGVSESLLRFGTALRCEERGSAFFYGLAGPSR